MQFTGLEPFERLGWAHPHTGDSLVVVVMRRLASGAGGHEEARVESAGSLTLGRDPVTHPWQGVGGQSQAVLCGECTHIDVAVVNRVAMRKRRVPIADHLPVGVDSKENAGFLVALTNRSNSVALVALTIGGIHLAARKHIHATSERRVLCAPQHEHLYARSRVTQQHHRRCRLDRYLHISHAGTVHTDRVEFVLVWMDLEMTGLEPGRNVIVEIATIVTDDDLNIVAEGPELVVHQREEALALMEQVVIDMHTKSGLLDQIRASTITLEDAGAQTLTFIKEHAPEARKVPLCGNSIGMDRRFLAAYLPEIENHLHYRSIDVSSVKELVRRWYPGLLNTRVQKAGSHRALDDIRESINELRFYREHIFVPTAGFVLPPMATADPQTK